MAIKYCCDGCDDEIRPYRVRDHAFTVTVEQNDQTLIGTTYHLCEPCGRQMLNGARPNQWVRRIPAPKVA